MSDLEFGIRVRVDGSELQVLAGQVEGADRAMRNLRDGGAEGGSGAAELARGIEGAGAAATRASSDLATLGSAASTAAQATRDVASAAGEQASALSTLSSQTGSISGEAATATEALKELGESGTSAGAAIAEAMSGAAGSLGGLADASAGGGLADQLKELGSQGADAGSEIAAGMGEAAEGMGSADKAGGKLTELIGGLLAGAVALLVDGLFQLVSGLFSAEEQAEATADATDLHRLSIEQLIEAIEAQNEALQRSIETGRQAELQAFATAFALQVEAEDRLKVAEAALAEAEAKAAAAREFVTPNDGTPFGAMGTSLIDDDLRRTSDRLRGEIAQARRAIAGANRGVGLAAVPLAQRASETRTDPSARIREDYDRALEAATARFLREAEEGGNPAARQAYDAALDAARAERERREAGLRESRRQPARGRQRGREREQPTPQEQMAEVLRAGGLSSAVVAGILGNIQQESRFDARLVGDRGTAFGHAQWRDERVANFQREIGVHPRNATAAQSGQFILWELANPGRAGMTVAQAGQIRGAQSPEDAARLFDRFYERSDGRAGNARAANARRFFDQGLASGDGGPVDAARALREMGQEADRLREFGERAAGSISDLTGQFDDTPSAVATVRETVGRLDELLADIEEKRPPNYEQLIEQARAARPVIEDSINKPYRDFILAQQESLEIARLEAAGRSDEAQARQAILQLEREMGPLSQERKDAVLATVQALRAEERQLEINRKRQEAYLGALGQTRTLIRDTVADALSGDVEALADIPGALARSFNELVAETLTENLFGDTFRQLEDQVTGTRIVEQAAERMSGAVDEVRADLRRFGEAVAGAAGAAERAATPAGAESTGWGSPVEAVADEWTRLWDDTFAAIAAAAGDEPEMVVTGERGSGDAAASDGWMPADGAGGFPRDPRAFFANMLTELLEDAFGPRFARLVGSTVSRGLEGAAYGSMVGGILRSAGVQTDPTGSALGGALGNIAGKELAGTFTKLFGESIGQFAGPLGSIAGSLIGGLLGSAISGPNKASATIGSVDGPLSVTGKSGLQGAATSLGQAVQEGVGKIAEALGGQLGAFSVSIGKRGDSFRVDPLGRGQTKAKGVLAFETEEEAVAAAILDAIKDGAVTGLSAAMQKALQSSSNIDKALREALKVREIEELLGGLSGELNKAFREFESQAAERVRIAREYGFDVLKIEELNAKERAELVERALEDRVGRLQDLLDDLKFGDLFEGSSVERREKLLAEIASEEARARAGEDGAADRVAELRRELIALTRSAFGTAGGEFAADRASTIASAEEIIRGENERIKAAQDAALGTNEKLGVNNQLTNETNNLLAEQNAILRGFGLTGELPNLAGGGDVRGTTARKVEL